MNVWQEMVNGSESNYRIAMDQKEYFYWVFGLEEPKTEEKKPKSKKSLKQSNINQSDVSCCCQPSLIVVMLAVDIENYIKSQTPWIVIES